MMHYNCTFKNFRIIIQPMDYVEVCRTELPYSQEIFFAKEEEEEETGERQSSTESDQLDVNYLFANITKSLACTFLLFPCLRDTC